MPPTPALPLDLPAGSDNLREGLDAPPLPTPLPATRDGDGGWVLTACCSWNTEVA